MIFWEYFVATACVLYMETSLLNKIYFLSNNI